MQKRELGRSGIRIAPLIFGGNVFGWTVDRTRAFALLDAFVEADFDAIDTADVYTRWVPGNSGGESETIIGEWIKARGNRKRVILATKCGHDMGHGRKGLSRAYIGQAAEESLKRLQTDYIDLYWAHRDDPETPLGETLEAFAGLIRAGKVRAIGASNYGAARLREALETSRTQGLPRYEALQPEYNLYHRQAFESELQPLCLEEGIGVTPYYALASGFLSGKYRSAADFSKSPRGGRMKNFLDARGKRILAALDEISAEYQTTPASVALAWLMAQPSIAAPIASATTLDQMREFSAAMRLKLSQAALMRLDDASKPEAN